MVENGKELTFTLSANTGFKVKTLTINGKTYSNITDKRITKKIKIEKNTEVSGAAEADTENPPIPGTKYKVTITQPANGKIEVTPALPSDGMVTKGSELTFTLSANKGFKVKTLTIDGTTYSDVTDNSITKTVKIEKDTAVSGTAEAETNPTQPNSDYENKNNGSSVKIVKQNNGQGAALTGNIYIDDLISNDFKEKLKDITGNIETSNLKINCFKPKTISGQSITTKNISDNFEAKVITPELLNKVLETGKDFSDLKLNNESNNKTVKVLFKSNRDNNKKDYFDISSLAKFTFNDKFELDNTSKIFLRGERIYNEISSEDNTDYPKASELLKLIENPKLKDNIIVGSVQIAGKLNELLPYLAKNEIQEEGDGIVFGNAHEIPCEGELWTGFDGNKGDTKKIEINELQELSKRTKDNAVYIRNAIIEYLDSKDENQIKDITFLESKLANVNFKNSDLSKIIMKKMSVQGYLKFEETTLPKTMEGSAIDDLILINSSFPVLNLTLGKTIKALPKIDNSLKIYNLKNRLFDQWTKEEIEKFKYKKEGPREFTGPRYIWEKFPYIKKDTNFIESNTTGSIQKIKDQYLALIQNQGRSRG